MNKILPLSILTDGVCQAGYNYNKKLDNYTPKFREVQFNSGINDFREKDKYRYYFLDLLNRDTVIGLITKDLPKTVRFEDELKDNDLIFESDVYALSNQIPSISNNSNNLFHLRDIIADVNNKYKIGINLNLEKENSFKDKISINLSELVSINSKFGFNNRDPSELIRDSLLSIREAYILFKKNYLKKHKSQYISKGSQGGN